MRADAASALLERGETTKVLPKQMTTVSSRPRPITVVLRKAKHLNACPTYAAAKHPASVIPQRLGQPRF